MHPCSASRRHWPSRRQLGTSSLGLTPASVPGCCGGSWAAATGTGVSLAGVSLAGVARAGVLFDGRGSCNVLPPIQIHIQQPGVLYSCTEYRPACHQPGVPPTHSGRAAVLACACAPARARPFGCAAPGPAGPSQPQPTRRSRPSAQPAQPQVLPPVGRRRRSPVQQGQQQSGRAPRYQRVTHQSRDPAVPAKETRARGAEAVSREWGSGERSGAAIGFARGPDPCVLRRLRQGTRPRLHQRTGPRLHHLHPPAAARVSHVQQRGRPTSSRLCAAGEGGCQRVRYRISAKGGRRSSLTLRVTASRGSNSVALPVHCALSSALYNSPRLPKGA